MRKQIYSNVAGGRVHLGWLSFQPDGSISFGLNDKTYIAPQFRARLFVWNAYNRIGVHYVVPTEPDALEPVRNPHFTYHPAVWFHLKADGPSGDDAIFEAIADVGITLEQQSEMPWIRAITAPLADLPTGGSRSGSQTVEHVGFDATNASCSVCIAVDFVLPGLPTRIVSAGPHWFINWHKVTIRLVLLQVPPQIPTLGWFHFY